jgi:hypothetical protein
MAITHKTTQKLDLAKYQTWIVDTDPNSTYFRLSQIPEVLNAGKNSILINGSPNLVGSTEVLMEITDGNGNVIFMEPIKNYSEGFARVVSIEVYANTPPGLAKITILGQIKVDVNGNEPPPEFRNAYNVKWERNIPIVSSQVTVAPARLYSFPTASVTEILNPFRQASQSIQTITGSSAFFLTGASLRNAILSGSDSPNSYIIKSSETSLIKQMEGGELRGTIETTSFTSSIVEVLNNSMARISPGFISGNIFENFTTNNFQILYTGSPDYLVSEYTRSFADVHLQRLSTFTGDISRIKVFVSSIDTPGNPELIGDMKVTANELLTTSSYADGEHKLRTGYFTDDSIPENYWVIGRITSMSIYNPLS